MSYGIVSVHYFIISRQQIRPDSTRFKSRNSRRSIRSRMVEKSFSKISNY
nr:hypothetical protein pmam_510 [Pithovirus mammoth]